jgi:hypothetical protein
VSTEARQADGGNITVQAPHTVQLRHSKITANVRGGPQTTGGNITIANPEFVIVQDSKILAKAVTGKGGDIDITAGVFLADPASRVDATASAEVGIDGTVDIRALVTNVSGTIAPLPQNFGRELELLRGLCAQRLRGGERSSFAVMRRDGLPIKPGDMLPSPLWIVERRNPEAATLGKSQLAHPARTVGRLAGDVAGQPQIRGWPSPVFLQTTLGLECIKRQRAQETPVLSKTLEALRLPH